MEIKTTKEIQEHSCKLHPTHKDWATKEEPLKERMMYDERKWVAVDSLIDKVVSMGANNGSLLDLHRELCSLNTDSTKEGK